MRADTDLVTGDAVRVETVPSRGVTATDVRACVFVSVPVVRDEPVCVWFGVGVFF